MDKKIKELTRNNGEQVVYDNKISTFSTTIERLSKEDDVIIHNIKNVK